MLLRMTGSVAVGGLSQRCGRQRRRLVLAASVLSVALVLLVAGCSGDERKNADASSSSSVPDSVAAEGSPSGVSSLSDDVEAALRSDDPGAAFVAALAANGFSDGAAACTGERVSGPLAGTDLLAASKAIDGDFLFDDSGAPIDAGAWTLVRAVIGCTPDETTAALADRGLDELAASCIARAAMSDESIAIALTLYSSSLRGGHKEDAAALAESQLDDAGAPATSGDPAARLLISRSASCTSLDAAAIFLAS